MTYKHNKMAVYKFMFNQFESAFGLTCIFGMMVYMEWLGIELAAALVIIILGLKSRTLKPMLDKIKGLRLMVTDGSLVFDHIDGEKDIYPLKDFREIAVKSHKGVVKSFKLYSESNGINIKNMESIDQLLKEIEVYVPSSFERRWWQIFK